MIKGQNLRIVMGAECIAAATSCTLSTSAQTEETSTKDSTGDWTSEETVSKSWEVTSDSLIEAVEDLDVALLVGNRVKIEFQNTGGEKNREMVAGIFTGSAIITGVTITAANKQNGTKTINFKGVSPLQSDKT